MVIYQTDNYNITPVGDYCANGGNYYCYPGYYTPTPIMVVPQYVMPPMPQFYPNYDVDGLIKALNRLAEAMEKQNVR